MQNQIKREIKSECYIVLCEFTNRLLFEYKGLQKRESNLLLGSAKFPNQDIKNLASIFTYSIENITMMSSVIISNDQDATNQCVCNIFPAKHLKAVFFRKANYTQSLFLTHVTRVESETKSVVSIHVSKLKNMFSPNLIFSSVVISLFVW